MNNQILLRSTKVPGFSQGAGVTSYASQLNLDQGILRFGLKDYRHVVCQTIEGRFTAVFLEGGIHAAQRGFFTVGL